MPERGDKDDVGVFRMDGDAPDMVGVGEPQVGPGRACVGRFEHADSGERTPGQQVLPGAHVEDIRIGGRHSEVADRPGRLVVEDRRPGHAVIDGLPDRAGPEAGVDGGGARHGIDGLNPAALKPGAE